MVRLAQRRKVRCRVGSAVGARHDVMDVQVARRAATWDLTSVVIASLHHASDGGCDALRCSFRFLRIDRADVLRVAVRLLDGLLVEVDDGTRAVLRSASTFLADRDRDLVQAARHAVSGRFECAAAEGVEKCVVVERPPALVLHHLAHLATERERLR